MVWLGSLDSKTDMCGFSLNPNQTEPNTPLEGSMGWYNEPEESKDEVLGTEERKLQNQHRWSWSWEYCLYWRWRSIYRGFSFLENRGFYFLSLGFFLFRAAALPCFGFVFLQVISSLFMQNFYWKYILCGLSDWKLCFSP